MPDHLVVLAAGQNGHRWAVLGDVARQQSVLRLHNDHVHGYVLARFHGGGSEPLRKTCLVLRRQLLKVEVGGLVVDASLGFRADLTEELDSSDRVLTIRCLLVQKNGVDAVKDAS